MKLRENKEQIDLVLAQTQIEGATKLLGGEVQYLSTLDHRGRITYKVVIEYGEDYKEKEKDVVFEGNYEGPLYARHPDLVAAELEAQ